MKYRLLINSIRGRKGEVIDLQDGNLVAQLRAAGIVGDPIDEGVRIEKIVAPQIIKPAPGPDVLKRRPGRPRKADASHASN